MSQCMGLQLVEALEQRVGGFEYRSGCCLAMGGSRTQGVLPTVLKEQISEQETKK
jgi:hypothetical protein